MIYLELHVEKKKKKKKNNDNRPSDRSLFTLSTLKISLHTESPQAICTSILRFVPDHKKINCIIASCFVFFLSSHAYSVTLGN